MKSKANFMSVIVIFISICCIEIPFINDIFFLTEGYSLFQKIVYSTINLMSLLGLSFLIRGIIFDLVFSIFARTFEIDFEIAPFNKYYKPILFVITLFFYSAALFGEYNYLYFCTLILCFQISANSQKIFITNNKAYYIDDYNLKILQIKSYKTCNAGLILYFEKDQLKCIGSYKKKNNKIALIKQKLFDNMIPENT